MRNLVVVGATGNIGQAVVLEALRREWLVTAVARDETRLRELSRTVSSPLLGILAADLSSELDVHKLVDGPLGDSPHAVVVTANVWSRPRRMLDWDPAALRDTWMDNLGPHLVAARAFLPRLRPDGVFLSLGGGTADFLAPGCAHMSVTQAGLRMVIRALAKEESNRGVHVKELLVRATVRGHLSNGTAIGSSIPAADVAAQACNIVAAPASYPEAVLTMP